MLGTKGEVMKLLKVVIDRSKWDVVENHRVLGVYYTSGRLIRDDGRGAGLQCCLGFVGKVCGVRWMTGCRMPSNVSSRKWPKSLVTRRGQPFYQDDTYIACELMKTNDTEYLTPKTREAKIIQLGRKADIAFKFEGKYLKAKEN
jgi:hypothetical protein